MKLILLDPKQNIRVSITEINSIYESENIEEAREKIIALLYNKVGAQWKKEFERDNPILAEFPTFGKLFKSQVDYQRVIAIMIREKFIDPISHKWIDLAPGYMNVLASIFRICYNKKYFNIENFYVRLFQIMAYESFKVELSESTLKHPGLLPHLYNEL